MLIPLVISALMAAGATTAGAAPAPDGSARHLAGKEQDLTVTLVTGDRVTLAGGDSRRLTVVPGEGRKGVKFRTERFDGKVYVVPSDAAPLLAGGRLDGRLFELNGLIKSGYDDRSAGTLPLIVTYDGAPALSSLRSKGATVTRQLPAVHGAAVRIAKGTRILDSLGTAGQRYAGGVRKVWLDGKRELLLDQSVPQIGGPAAWQAGYTGKGVTVAVLDTGIDTTHPDLATQVTEAKNFTDAPAGDDVGHGTHVASTIAGTAAASAGKYKGVAPDAKLLDGKVCAGLGCDESAILAGMQWAAAEKHADVINLSLGGPDSPDTDPLEEAVNTLTAQTGSLFVIAAGNDGPNTSTVGSPGSADAALTVGAVDKSDELAGFSSRGPRVGDGAIKPDLTAPGVSIVAAKAKDAWIGEPVGDRYLRLDGTSMATPHVAGSAALLVQEHPDWTPDEIKTALTSSAKPHPVQTAFEQGAGRVDLTRAIHQSVVAQAGGLSFGTARWPHGDDTPVTKDLTYRNLGTAPVTLQLQATFTGPGGAPVPDGAFSLSASTVTVPAGGTASVSATSNTRHEGPDGAYTGRVTATGPDGVQVVAPIGVDKEVESYDLTLTLLGPDGQPSATSSAALIGYDQPRFDFLSDPSGVVKVRRPKGRYFLDGAVSVQRSEEQWDFYYLIQPVVTLDRDTAITIDARNTKGFDLTVQRPEAKAGIVDVGVSIDLGGEATGVSASGASFGLEGFYTGVLGDPLPSSQLTAHVASQWAVPDGEGRFLNSPYLYSLVNTRQGSPYAGFTRHARDKEFAKVTSSFNAGTPLHRASKTVFGFAPGMGSAWALGLAYDLPGRLTSYLEPGAVDWSGEFAEFVLDPEGFPQDVTRLSAPSRRYSANRSYAEHWNQAVYGPSAATAYAQRAENSIAISVPMYSDQAGHGGLSLTDTASTKLYRNGALLGESKYDAYVEVNDIPAESGAFKLVSAATRPTVSGLSWRTDATWTFRSKATSADGEALPLWAVRYFPSVDSHNTVRRQRTTVLPIRLETPPGSPAGKVRTLEVRVSGDNGTHWTRATVRRAGNGYVAVFRTPPGKTISLNATLSDTKANTTNQTIIAAYTLR